MKLEVHHYFHDVESASVTNKLDAILKLLQESKNREVQMTKELDDLGTQVEGVTTAVGSAITLIDKMATNIIALKDNPVKLVEYANQLKSTKEQLAAKVFENTDVTPEEPPVVEASLKDNR